MKKITLVALCWPLFQMLSKPVFAQKEKTKNESHEIIIIKNGEKEKKLTIETKDGEVFINGKPSSEYKGDDVSVIKSDFLKGDIAAFGPNNQVFNFSTNMHTEKGAYLGVTTDEVKEGAKITNVSKESAADKAGLKEGDIITKVDNFNVKDPDDLSAAVKKYKPNQDVTVYYNREGINGNAKVTLGERSRMRAFNFSGGGGNSTYFRDFHNIKPLVPAMPREHFTMSWGSGGRRLGVSIEDTDNETGAKITDVYDDSPAAKSGLKENDIITEVNGKKVKDVNEVRKEMAEVKDKNSYNIKARRNGADMTFEIKIPKRINKASL